MSTQNSKSGSLVAQKDIEEIRMVIMEIKNIYSKIENKLDILKKTTSHDFVQTLRNEITTDLYRLDKVGSSLELKAPEELAKIKEKMLMMFDSATADEREIDLLYEKENILRSSKSADFSYSCNNFNPGLSRKLLMRESEEFFKMKQKVSTSATSGSARKCNRFEEPCLSHRSSRFSPTKSLEDKNFEKFSNEEDYTPKRSISPPINIKKLNFNKPDLGYIESLWTKFHKFGSIQREDPAVLRASSAEPRTWFSDISEFREFIGEKGKHSKNIHLWKYISYFQEVFLSEISNLRQQLFKLTTELTQKDLVIKNLQKNLAKKNVLEESSYYQNLKLISNPKEIISKIKHSRQNSSNLHSKKPSWSSNTDWENQNCDFNIPFLTQIQNLNTSNNGLVNISTNQSINYLNTELNVNCNFIDITSSLSNPLLNPKQKAKDSHQIAQVKVLEETIQYLRENNTLLQAENDKLKEAVNYLNKKIEILEEHPEYYEQMKKILELERKKLEREKKLLEIERNEMKMKDVELSHLRELTNIPFGSEKPILFLEQK